MSTTINCLEHFYGQKELKYPFGFVREKEQVKEANRLIREIGFTSKLINAESPVGNLSGGKDKV